MTPQFLSSTAEYNFLIVSMTFKPEYNVIQVQTQCHSNSSTNTISCKYKCKHAMSLKCCRMYSVIYMLSSTYPWPSNPKYNIIQNQTQTNVTQKQILQNTLCSACPWPSKPITLFVSSALCSGVSASNKRSFLPPREPLALIWKKKLICPEILEIFT